MKIIEAKLIRHVSPMGGTEMRDELPIGKRYKVDADSICIGERVVIATGEQIFEEMIQDINGGWLPTGVLSLQAKIAES